MDQVVVVIYLNPTAVGPIVKKIFRHYGDAELFVQRQADPEFYTLSVMAVEY